MIESYNTEAYNIVFEGGACGAFFACLLMKILNPLCGGTTISTYGDAHPTLKEIDFNTIFFNDSWWDKNIMHVEPKYEFSKPRNPEIPCIWWDHALPDYEKYFSMFPNGKIFYITVADEDIPRVLGNFFHKVVVPLYFNDRKAYNRSVKETPQFIDRDPTELTVDECKTILNHSNSVTYKQKFPPFMIPDEYRFRIFQFRLGDIINKKNETLQRLSAITERVVTEEAITYYDEYLLAQKELVETKMPWVTI